MTDRNIDAARYDFAISGEPGEDGAVVGVFIIEQDGSCNRLVMKPDVAQGFGRMLCAHSDYLAQRAPREWE
jgi:hypothetical protein